MMLKEQELDPDAKHSRWLHRYFKTQDTEQ